MRSSRGAGAGRTVRAARRRVLAAGSGGGITRCAGGGLHPSGRSTRAWPYASGEPPSCHGGARCSRHARPPGGGRLERLVKRRVSAPPNPATLVAEARDTVIAAVTAGPSCCGPLSGRDDTLASDAGWFRNQVWRASDVPYVSAAPHPVRRGRVVWDEYHQGLAGVVLDGGAHLDWLLQSAAGWADPPARGGRARVAAVTAVRFGPARSVIEGAAARLEHLERSPPASKTPPIGHAVRPSSRTAAAVGPAAR